MRRVATLGVELFVGARWDSGLILARGGVSVDYAVFDLGFDVRLGFASFGGGDGCGWRGFGVSRGY